MKLLTIDQFAEIFCVSRQIVERKLKSGLIKGISIKSEKNYHWYIPWSEKIRIEQSGINFFDPYKWNKKILNKISNAQNITVQENKTKTNKDV